MSFTVRNFELKNIEILVRNATKADESTGAASMY